MCRQRRTPTCESAINLGPAGREERSWNRRGGLRARGSPRSFAAGGTVPGACRARMPGSDLRSPVLGKHEEATTESDSLNSSDGSSSGGGRQGAASGGLGATLFAWLLKCVLLRTRLFFSFFRPGTTATSSVAHNDRSSLRTAALLSASRLRERKQQATDAWCCAFCLACPTGLTERPLDLNTVYDVVNLRAALGSRYHPSCARCLSPLRVLAFCA